MSVWKSSRFSFGIAILLALAVFSGVANAASCSNPSSGTVTCTGGTGMSVSANNDNNTSTAFDPTVNASPFPSSITVTGGGAAVKTVSVTLHGYSGEVGGPGSDPFTGSRDMGLLLISPSGHNLQLMRAVGDPNTDPSNITFTIQDGGTTMPSATSQGSDAIVPLANGATYAPGAYNPSFDTGEQDPVYSNLSSQSLLNDPTPDGSKIMSCPGGVFCGDTIIGTWNLYLVTDAFQQTNISISSWDITITFTAASTSSSTGLATNNSTPFTASPNNSATLTATVTTGATGSVTFVDTTTSTQLTCTEGSQPRPLSLTTPNTATCTTSFTTEGIHALQANYSGDSTFESSDGTANIFASNHTTNTTTDKYCNPGAVSVNNGSGPGGPYPSVVHIGAPDGTTDITTSVNSVSVILNNFSSNESIDLHMLLVAPDGTHALDFWSNAGSSISNGTFTLEDSASSQLPADGAISANSYLPTTYGSGFTPNTDLFTPGPATPAPQLPSTYSVAFPSGSATFTSSFVGAAGHGTWSLFLYNGSGAGATTSLANGWCLDVSPGTGKSTSTSVSAGSNPFFTKGATITFTANVTSSPTNPNEGTVTFTENGAPVVGTPNSGVANVSNGVATISTSSLPEGDHTIEALYSDGTAGNFNDSFGTTAVRVDAATSTPTLSTNTWSYCNASGITIPAGNVTADDIGPAAPNPSNIFVTNLYGTIDTVTLTIDNFHLPQGPNILESLLVGPNGTNAPTTTQTLDFFSQIGDVTAFTQTMTFEDGAAEASCSTNTTPPGTTIGPTSCGSEQPYTASAFYSLPSGIQRAGTAGSFTFDTGTLTPTSGGVYANTNPNGTWSLYFDQTLHDSGSSATGWCLNFVENPVSISASKTHTGYNPGGANHFIQGEQGAQFNITVTNNGTGSTGDPDGNHPLTVTDTLSSALTLVSCGGSGWSGSASGQNVTCVNHGSVAQGNSYPVLNINVNVSASATPGAITNQASVSGGGASGTPSSNVDTVTIDQAPSLGVSKSHTGTFTQGQTAQWNITVSNTSSGGSTNGTTNVSDTLPNGYTINSINASGWSCPGSVSTGTLSCTSTQQVAAGGSFNQIQVTVNVPATSPTSVTNTALAWGGGDLVHTTSGNAAQGSDTNVPVVQVPAHVNISSGNNQNTTINTPFTNPLVVTVTDAASVVINNTPVVFLAPATGASAVFSNVTNTITANTNSSGQVSESVSANGSVGGYQVSATAGSASTNFSLTNNGVAAVITNVTSTTANGSYTVGAVIPIQVTFNKAVTVTGGPPLLALNSGGTASYTSGSGTATLTFTYTVAAGQNSTKLDATSTTALSLNGGTINDSTSTPANLTLPTPGGAGSLGANKSIVIDTTAPTVVSYSVVFGTSNLTFNLGTSTRNRLPWEITGVQVVFSKPIATADANSLTGVATTGFSGLGTNTLTWSISPIALAAVSTNLAGSGADAIKDAAGNALAGGAGFAQNFKVLWGDVNDDGVVNAADGVLVVQDESRPYTIFADMNGDGVVNATDVNIVRTRIGTSLP